MSTRPPPPSGDPPRYHKYMNRYNLRFPFMISAGIGFIWGIARGVSEFRNMSNDDNPTSTQKIFNIVIGALCLVVAAIELYCIVVAAVQNIRLAKLFNVIAPLGVLVAIGASVMAIVAHFVTKKDLIGQCAVRVQGAYELDGYGNQQLIDDTEANRLCTSDFNHDTWTVIAWLIFVLILSIFFAGMALSYYRQLVNGPTPVQQSYPLQPQPPQGQGQGYWGPPPTQQQSWMVPPYPGPPPAGEPFEKNEYHPSVDWAQETYAPPAGPPPRSGFDNHRAEEEAWERARSEGVTAHLTGHGPAPVLGRSEDEERGYAVAAGNVEEEEAWQRAREGGVTAHLTGHAKKPENDV